MARHRGSRGRTQNTSYLVAGLIVAVVVVGLIYVLGPFGADRGKAPNDLNGVYFETPDPPETDDNDVGIGFVPSEDEVEKTAELDGNDLKVDPLPDVQANPRAGELIAEAMAMLSGSPSRIIEARDMLNETLSMPMSLQQRMLVKDQLSKLAEQWLFSKTFYPQDKLCGSYEVQSGDKLSLIGKKFDVPYELLMEVNKIAKPEALRADQRIKVVNGPFHVKVYRSAFMMDVYLQGTYVKSFPVGLGASGRQTPLGLWHIKAGGKIPNALYTDPDTGKTIHPEDPEYPLGSRWMELEGLDENTKDKTGFGIHGTKDPSSIGKASSRGCVRLHNGDVIKVYNMLVPVKSLVKILE
ncbi:MAG: L,D-transpeptidase family protein [Sedimentisphaerales bacterium]|nr:L,D-transpeptidase family protein [Sedimentisphaerales bacterium]